MWYQLHYTLQVQLSLRPRSPFLRLFPIRGTSPRPSTKLIYLPLSRPVSAASRAFWSSPASRSSPLSPKRIFSSPWRPSRTFPQRRSCSTPKWSHVFLSTEAKTNVLLVYYALIDYWLDKERYSKLHRKLAQYPVEDPTAAFNAMINAAANYAFMLALLYTSKATHPQALRFVSSGITRNGSICVAWLERTMGSGVSFRAAVCVTVQQHLAAPTHQNPDSPPA